MSAPDRFGQWKETAREQPTYPLTQAVEVDAIKSDAVDLPFLPRAIHVSVAGIIKMNVGTVTPSVTITQTFEIGWHPISPTRIWAAVTTATGITAWA
jgi:hypothetical protein